MCDDLNRKLCNQDMHDRINGHRTRCLYNLENDPLHIHQRFAEVENNPVNQWIVDLHEQIEWLQRNNDHRNAVVRNLLKKTESPFSEDIRMPPMPSRLKLPKLVYDGMGDLAEYLETYKS